MTAAIVILSITAAVLAITLAGAGRWATREIAAARTEAGQLRDQAAASGYRALIGHRVTASVVDGGSIRGVLLEVYEDSLVIDRPEFVGGARPAGIGRDITLARSSVPMLQRFADGETQD